jgi:hypothetical protein
LHPSHCLKQGFNFFIRLIRLAARVGISLVGARIQEKRHGAHVGRAHKHTQHARIRTQITVKICKINKVTSI